MVLLAILLGFASAPREIVCQNCLRRTILDKQANRTINRAPLIENLTVLTPTACGLYLERSVITTLGSSKSIYSVINIAASEKAFTNKV